MLFRRKSNPGTDPRATPPDAEARRLTRARACWEQARADLAEAKATLRQGNELQGGYLSLQAAVNAMACVCTLHGEFQFPSHSPSQLANLCAGFDPRFKSLTEPGAALEAVQELNPFAGDAGSAAPPGTGREAYAHGETVVASVRRYLKANRGKYFKP